MNNWNRKKTKRVSYSLIQSFQAYQSFIWCADSNICYGERANNGILAAFFFLFLPPRQVLAMMVRFFTQTFNIWKVHSYFSKFLERTQRELSNGLQILAKRLLMVSHIETWESLQPTFCRQRFSASHKDERLLNAISSPQHKTQRDGDNVHT